MNKEDVKEVARNTQPANEQKSVSTKTVENPEDQRTLDEKETSKKKYLSWYCYGLCAMSVILFFGEGGFSLSIWWWIVFAFMALLGLGIYGDKDNNTKGSLDGIKGMSFVMSLCVFLMSTCMDGGSSSTSDKETEITTRKCAFCGKMFQGRGDANRCPDCWRSKSFYENNKELVDKARNAFYNL